MNKPRVPIQLHNAVMISLRHYLSAASQFFKFSFAEPIILYRNKGSIAGSALLQKWQIQLNIAMLLENRAAFIDEVIPHELAHLIAYQQFGRVKPHGKEWQMIMQQIFLHEAKRTHSFNLPQSLTPNRYHYYCPCQNYLLTNIRHQKVQQNRAHYYCKKCGSLLRLQSPSS